MSTVEAKQGTFIVIPMKEDFDEMIPLRGYGEMQALCNLPCRQPCACSCHVHVQDNKEEGGYRF